MNKVSKSLMVLFLTFLIGSCFSIDFIQAQADGLSLDVIEKCNFQYGGETCIAEFDITNSTGEILDGTALFNVGYSGVCGELFKVGGIDAWYDNQVPKMEWDNENRRFVFAGFEIPNGLSKANLEIHTSSALCPGEYTFSLELKGTTEKEEYIAPPVTIGGGGGGATTPTPTPGPLSSEAQKVDANNDDRIDILDFNTLMVNWGSTVVDNIADFDNDGKVDIFDFNLLMIHWTG